MAFLKRVQAEQALLSAHSHAPVLKLKEALDTADAALVDDVRQRQVFTWDVGMRARHNNDSPLQALKLVWFQGFMNVGILWLAGLTSSNCLRFDVAFDRCQLSVLREIHSALDAVFVVVDELCDARMWEKPIWDEER